MPKLSRNNKPATASSGRPPAAVEVAPEGVLAAALPGAGQPPVHAFVPLPAGALTPGVAEANIRASEVVAEAIRGALEQVSPRTRHVTLIVPDIAVRVFVLDFDSLPAKSAEAVSVLRFRLRKMVPFDVEHAALSHQVLVNDKATIKVLVTVMPGAILAEYEAAVRATGYEPGAILPSSLAALAAVESLEPILAANLSGHALTTSITSGQDLLLFRTIELPADRETRIADVQRSIVVAAAFYEDKLMGRPREVHYAGSQPVADFARLVGDPELAIVDMVSPSRLGATATTGPISLAGIAGALAGV